MPCFWQTPQSMERTSPTGMSLHFLRQTVVSYHCFVPMARWMALGRGKPNAPYAVNVSRMYITIRSFRAPVISLTDHKEMSGYVRVPRPGRERRIVEGEDVRNANQGASHAQAQEEVVGHRARTITRARELANDEKA
jgi:hypothetical protein